MKRIVAVAAALVVVLGLAGECQAGPIKNLIDNVRARRAERCQPAPAVQYHYQSAAYQPVVPVQYAAPEVPATSFRSLFLSPLSFGRTCTGPNCPR